MPAVDCCVQLIHSILCTVLWTKYLVTQPCRHVNRAASDASVSLSPASSPGHVSSFLLHALRLRGLHSHAVARLQVRHGLMEAVCEENSHAKMVLESYVFFW